MKEVLISMIKHISPKRVTTSACVALLMATCATTQNYATGPTFSGLSPAPFSDGNIYLNSDALGRPFSGTINDSLAITTFSIAGTKGTIYASNDLTTGSAATLSSTLPSTGPVTFNITGLTTLASFPPDSATYDLTASDADGSTSKQIVVSTANPSFENTESPEYTNFSSILSEQIIPAAVNGIDVPIKTITLQNPWGTTWTVFANGYSWYRDFTFTPANNLLTLPTWLSNWQGQHTITATDAANNSCTHNLFVSTQPPSLRNFPLYSSNISSMTNSVIPANVNGTAIPVSTVTMVESSGTPVTGSPFSGGSITIPSGLSVGVYTLTATDDANNRATQQLVVSTAQPTFSTNDFVDSNPLYINGSSAFKGTVDLVAVSGNTTVYVPIKSMAIIDALSNSKPIYNFSSDKETGFGSYTIPAGFPNGIYTLSVTDMAGNTGTQTVPPLIISNIAPSISFSNLTTASDGNIYMNATALTSSLSGTILTAKFNNNVVPIDTFSIKGTDANMNVILESLMNYTSVPTQNSTPFDFTPSTLSPAITTDGTYTLSVIDEAGNETKQKIIVNSTLPSFEASYFSPRISGSNIYIGGNLSTLSGRIKQNNVPLQSLTIAKTGTTVNTNAPYTITNGINSFAFTIDLSLLDNLFATSGTYSLTATDFSGNISTDQPVIVCLDSPTLTFPTGTLGDDNNINIDLSALSTPVSGTATMASIGQDDIDIDSITIKGIGNTIYGPTRINFTTSGSDASFTFTPSALSGFPQVPGNYLLTVKDIAGNTVTENIIVKAQPPKLTLPTQSFNPALTLTTGTAKAASGKASVTVGGIAVTVDGSGKFTMPSDLPSGVYPVIATDPFGNQSVGGVIVDVSFPSISWMDPQQYIGSGTTAFSGMATKPLQSASLVNGSTTIPLTIDATNQSAFSLSNFSSVTNLTDGLWFVSLTDLAGNQIDSNLTENQLIVHKTPPTLTLPTQDINFLDLGIVQNGTTGRANSSIPLTNVMINTTSANISNSNVEEFIIPYLSTGSHKVTVTDAALNVTTQNINVKNIPALVLPGTIINPNATVVMGKTNPLNVVNNTVVIGSTSITINPDGTFVIPALNAGTYTITVTDPDSDTNSGTITVVTQGPQLVLPPNPINPMLSNSMGQTSPGSVVAIDGKKINVDASGNFALLKDLTPGIHNVTSRDQAGNVSFGTFTVKTSPPALSIVGLSGSTDIGSTVIIGNQSVPVDGNGNFTLPNVANGLYTITATDVAENVTTKSIKIAR